MRRLRKILVSVRDPHARANASIRKAAAIAAAFGAELELFHDIDTPIFIETLSDWPKGLELLRRDGRLAALQALERLAAPLRARGLKVSTAAEWDFPPFEAIVRRAKSTGAQLIVTRCRARHPLGRLLGYTDWALLGESPVPVLLVKSGRAYERPVILAAIDPEHAHAKPDNLDVRVLAEAAALARALGGRCHAVHAYQPLALPVLDAAIPYAEMADEVERRASDRAKRAFRDALTGRAIPASCRHLVEANPFLAIPGLAHRLRSSVVVMGAVSRRGVRRLFIGNTAEKVLDKLKCDVLVVKPAKFGGRIGRARRGMNVVSAVN